MCIFWRLRPLSASLLSKYQDLALRFPGLSRTKLIFQNFPDPGNYRNTIPGLCGRHRNPTIGLAHSLTVHYTDDAWM